MKRAALLVSFILTVVLIKATINWQNGPSPRKAEVPPAVTEKVDPAFLYENAKWADSLIKVMTPEERIGQLFMVAAFSNKDQAHVNHISNLVKNYKIGGLCFFQGGPARQAKLTNLYQSQSKVPLFISIDGEWGLSMRLDSTVRYPRQMMLGAIQNDSLIYQMGVDIAKQCKRIGIHANFSPVADVNNNPNNPVINTRSFGEDKMNVVRKCIAYMKGLQDNRIMATAKHFPGHGDTDSDSHKTLPTVNHDRKHLDSLELYAFRQLVDAGVGSIMVAHLSVPALDSTKTASSISKPIITDLLKNEMGFKGLVFTDALNMKGVASNNTPGYVDVKALLAGNDILLYAEDVPTAIEQIKKAIAEKKITQQEIDDRCKKILLAKKWFGLDKRKTIDLKNLNKDLNNVSSDLLNYKLAEGAMTLAINKDSIIPFRRLDTLKIASVAIDGSTGNIFQKNLKNYAPVKCYTLNEDAASATSPLLADLASYNMVIVSLHNPKHSFSKNTIVTDNVAAFIKQLEKKTKVTTVVFANPYSLAKITPSKNTAAVLMAYEDSKYTQSMAAQALFGGISVNGKLPVTASSWFKAGQGDATGKAIRLKYTIPEELNIKSEDIGKIDSLAKNFIKQGAFPGCVVLVAKDQKVFYNKAFGKHTYNGDRKEEADDIFDIASVTKIMASTISLMKLNSEGKFDVNGKLEDYLPELKGTNKGNLKNIDILTHQARLQPWIPFFKKTLQGTGYVDGIYSTTKTGEFTLKVAEDMYMRQSYVDTMYKAIIESPLIGESGYKYSDMGYYLYKKIIEKETGMSLPDYLNASFYRPLGLETMGFNPLERFEKDRIVPTENDKIFRHQQIQGYVHDQGAAMLGGVCGHAGIFADANDLAIVLQMLLNNGVYGGKRYLNEDVVKEYTKCQFCKNNRRGIGFDKPAPSGDPGPTCDCVSMASYGHQGFTGTQVWADPENGLIYIFLSNRVFPDADNKKINTLGVRSGIQQAIYDALPKGPTPRN